MAGTPASVSGARLTSTVLSARKVTNMAPKIMLLEDDKKSLMTFAGALGTRPTDNATFSWLTDEIIPKTGTTGASAASVAASATSGTLDLSGQTTAVYLKVDDVIKFPSTGHICRVTATPTNMNSVAVIVNVAGNVAASAATAALGAVWTKIGNAKIENSRLYDTSNNLESIALTEASASNYTQTFRNQFGMSRREMQTNMYGGPDRAHQRMKKLLEHCEEINNAFWHGVSASEANGRTYTGGILSFIPSSNTNAITTLTEDAFEDFVRRATRYGNRKRRVLFCSRYIGQLISGWARANQRVTNPGGTVKYGVEVTEYHAGCGTVVDIVTDQALEGLPGSTTLGTWDGYGALLDPAEIKKVVFMGGDTQLATDVQFKDQDGVVDAYLSDVGIQPGHPSHHALMTGITS